MAKTNSEAAAPEAPAEAAAPEAPAEATMRRSIQMKDFSSKTEQAEVALAFAKTPDDRSTWQKPIGQIVGRISEVVRRTFEAKGEIVEALSALGEFEAVNYRTGEVMESMACDLPRYYLEGVEATLKRNDGAAILLGVEIVLVATGKSIPFAYEVRNLIDREPDNPLNRLKAAMAAKGRLRLPPPANAGQPVLTDADRAVEPEPEADAPAA